MREYPSGFEVELADFDRAQVPDGRDYQVTAEGALVVTCGDRELATFPSGAWLSVKRVGRALRGVWPPDDFDYVMDRLGKRLVVGFGMDFRYGSERFLDPHFNDFNALVDAITELEGGTAGYDSEYRRWVSVAVAEAFGVDVAG